MKKLIFILIALIVIIGAVVAIFLYYNRPDLIIENITVRPPGILDVSIKNIGKQDAVGRIYLCLVDYLYY